MPQPGVRDAAGIRRVSGRHEADTTAAMRILAVGLAIAVVVYLATAGHVIFLPLLFVPLGLFGFGRRRRRRGLY